MVGTCLKWFAEKITTGIYVNLMVARHLLKSLREKIRLCQIATLCHSQEFMPQIATGFVYFVFMILKLIFI